MRETAGNEAAPRVLLADTDGWTDVGLDLAGGPVQAAPHAFGEFIRSFVQSEQLVVLAGLGASRCVTDEHGRTPCPSMDDLWTDAKSNAGASFAEIARKVKYTVPTTPGDIEELLSRCQMFENFHEDSEVTKFALETEEVIVARCRFPQPGHSLRIHEAFLRTAVRRSARQPRLKVFTTNYDLSFERAGNNSRFIVVDGFSHSLPQEFDAGSFSYDFVRREDSAETPNYIPNVFHLYKLHGSVDWEVVEGRVIRNPQAKHPLIVYPRNSKFESSYTPPFVEMMSRFQLVLRENNVALLIIGAGLRDGHLKGPIEAAIRGNVGLRVVVVDPQLETNPHAVAKEMAQLIALGDRRLALCAATFEKFVPLMPVITAETERQRHSERVQRASR